MFTSAGCAPHGIPPDATRQWSFIDGYYWTWVRPAKSGCLSWMAVKDWASVVLLVDKPCRGIREPGIPSGKGLRYLSFEDELVFKGYWPWSSEIYDKLLVFDHRGMYVGTRPCPNSLTQEQISQMRATAIAALGVAVASAERRVISRIVDRLGRVDGNALSSQQGGCSDWKDGDDTRHQVDSWSAR